jgi:hypothetical protein
MPRFRSLYSRYFSTIRRLRYALLAVFWYFAESFVISGDSSALR